MMRASCTTATHIGDARMCDVIFGFHFGLDGLLDSGLGIPQGQKLLLSTRFTVESPVGGRVIVHYKLLNFATNEMEVFRINLDGETLIERTESTTDNAASKNFETYTSDYIRAGQHILDIVFLSVHERFDPAHESKARVLI